VKNLRQAAKGLGVSAAALALVAGGALLAGGAAIAAGTITSGDIKDQTIQSRDIGEGGVGTSELRNNDVRRGDIKDGAVGPGEILDGSVRAADLDDGLAESLKGEKGDPGEAGAPGADGADGADGKDGVFAVQAAALAAPMAIEKIGGPINDNNTDLGVALTLPAGKYVVTVDGAFSSDTAGDAAVDIYPQLSLWLDKNADGAFTWSDEGDISPNAVMPTAANRHISVHGTTVVTLEAETKVGLLGFGYTSTQGSERSGEIDVVRAALTATPVIE
jgi:hypothetical protein